MSHESSILSAHAAMCAADREARAALHRGARREAEALWMGLVLSSDWNVRGEFLERMFELRGTPELHFISEFLFERGRGGCEHSACFFHGWLNIALAFKAEVTDSNIRTFVWSTDYLRRMHSDGDVFAGYLLGLSSACRGALKIADRYLEESLHHGILRAHLSRAKAYLRYSQGHHKKCSFPLTPVELEFEWNAEAASQIVWSSAWEAIRAGYAEGHAVLGEALWDGVLWQQDLTAAFRHFVQGASAGSGYSAFCAALMLDGGFSTSGYGLEAMRGYYERSLEWGCERGCYPLGMAYLGARGGGHDVLRGLSLIRRAATLGVTDAEDFCDLVEKAIAHVQGPAQVPIDLDYPLDWQEVAVHCAAERLSIPDWDDDGLPLNGNERRCECGPIEACTCERTTDVFFRTVEDRLISDEDWEELWMSEECARDAAAEAAEAIPEDSVLAINSFREGWWERPPNAFPRAERVDVEAEIEGRVSRNADLDADRAGWRLL